MVAVTRPMTVEDYLAFDEQSEFKHEYIDGEVIPMPGGTGRHNVIVANAIAALGIAVSDLDCLVYGSQMRVRIDDARYVYPDVSVVCGIPEYEGEKEVILFNPTVVLEVTSPSAMTHDHVEKVAFYGSIPSIQGYLILDQERVFAEWYERTKDGWHLRQFTDPADTIELSPIGCSLPLSTAYRGIVFQAN